MRCNHHEPAGVFCTVCSIAIAFSHLLISFDQVVVMPVNAINFLYDISRDYTELLGTICVMLAKSIVFLGWKLVRKLNFLDSFVTRQKSQS